jgi:protein-S-isoprenylcysteine O-methyltransferase Ste14
MKTRHITPLTYLLIAIVLVVLAHALLPLSAPIPAPWNLLGIIPLALGIALNLVADAALRRQRTTVKPFEASTALITTGIYRVSRHPMYLGMVLILAGIAVMLGTLAPFALVAAFTVLLERVFVRTEERMLAEQFGDAWEAYRRQVRRWI